MSRGLVSFLVVLALAGLAKLFPNKKSVNNYAPDEKTLTKFELWGKISGWIVLAAIISGFYVLASTIPHCKRCCRRDLIGF